MSNKNLLSEAQIRQMMKLARLEPLTAGFVDGLTERGAKKGDQSASRVDYPDALSLIHI